MAPLYVVLAVVFGGVDPIFRTVIPVWNPILWSSDQPIYVLTHIVGDDGIFGPALLRTAVYVLTASVLCLLIAFPIAYYVARLSGRWKGLLLALLIAPFWISYMMRMLAWVNLLANDGLVNRIISVGGLLPGRRRVALREVGGGDPRPGLRLRALHDHPVVRRPRPLAVRPHRRRPRPGRQPFLGVLAGHLADVATGAWWPACC